MHGPTDANRRMCPSAQPDMDGPIVLGVVCEEAGTARTSYLDERIALSEELLTSTLPVDALQVLRIAAACEESRCAHFDGQKCQLARRIVGGLPAVVSQLPDCTIRSDCRWYWQEGSSACVRCPQIVTLQHTSDPVLVQIAGVTSGEATVQTPAS
jgi:hypothetical protein